MEALGDKLKVSKLGAVGRQLHTAIDLYFADGDPVSIHTFTAAAHTGSLKISPLSPGRERRFIKHS